VDLVNSLQPDTVVEVGCGIGDILSRVRARERIGFDIDSAVIRAARFLHPGRVRWISGGVASVEKYILPGRRIDCLIMVNWIHNLSAEQLAACVLPILPRVGHVLVDSIDSDAPASFRFRHDFEFLSGAAERISVTRAPREPRTLVLFRVV
jgi:SAM-dependent methyltransferase